MANKIDGQINYFRVRGIEIHNKRIIRCDGLIISWENPLGPAYAPGKGDHAGNVDPKRAVAAGT